jgi:hypothetical protein
MSRSGDIAVGKVNRIDSPLQSLGSAGIAEGKCSHAVIALVLDRHDGPGLLCWSGRTA